MPIEKQLEHLTLQQQRSVIKLTKAWSESDDLRSPESPRLEIDRPGLDGKQLILRLLCNAQVCHTTILLNLKLWIHHFMYSNGAHL